MILAASFGVFLYHLVIAVYHRYRLLATKTCSYLTLEQSGTEPVTNIRCKSDAYSVLAIGYIKKLIEEDQLNMAAELMMPYLKRNQDSENYWFAMAIKGQMNSNEREWLKQTITYEDYSIARNRQRQSLIFLFRELIAVLPDTDLPV